MPFQVVPSWQCRKATSATPTANDVSEPVLEFMLTRLDGLGHPPDHDFVPPATNWLQSGIYKLDNPVADLVRQWGLRKWQRGDQE